MRCTMFSVAVPVLILLGASPQEAKVLGRRFKKTDKTFDDKQTALHEVSAVSLLKCNVKCSVHPGCLALEYKRTTSHCTMYGHLGVTDGSPMSVGRVSDDACRYVISDISCANYKLENARVDVDVINSDPKDVCNTNFIASDDNTSSCYTGASLEVVPVKCVSCYIGKARLSMVPSKYYTEELPFDLAAGMKLRLEVSGNKAVFNSVQFVDSGMNQVYHFSLRWRYTPARAVFNTKKGRTFGREKVVYGVSVNGISNYIIEVHISESDFMTYVDGTLLMTNQMRLPFTGVRRVTFWGFTALHSLHVGYVLC